MLGNPDILVVKTDNDGSFLWGYVYPAPRAESAFQVIAAGYDSGYVVCGWTYSFGPDPKPNLLLLRLTKQGVPLWAKVYSIQPVNLYAERGCGIDWLQSPENQIAVVGTVRSDTSSCDAFALMLDSEGNPNWCRLVAGLGDAVASSVIHDYDTLVVAGWTNSFSTAGDADVLLWKLKVSGGDAIWAQTCGHPGVDDKAEGSQSLGWGHIYHCGDPLPYLVAGYTEFPHATGTDFLYVQVYDNGGLESARRHPSSFGSDPSEEAANAFQPFYNDCLLGGWSDNPAFTRGEDFHLLAANSYGHVPLLRCTRSDSLVSVPVTHVTSACQAEDCHFGAVPYPMQRVDVLTRKPCIPFARPWTRTRPIPGLERIRSGGGVSPMADSVHCILGGGSLGFRSYSIDSRGWHELPAIPAGPDTVGVGKGGCIANDRRRVFAVKGNNTQEVYRYSPGQGVWQPLPEPGFSTGINGGSAVHCGSGQFDYLYLACGSGTSEWKRFNLGSDQWENCVPTTLPPGRIRVGTSMALRGSTLHLLQAGDNKNRFYSLELESANPVWIEKAELPLEGRSGQSRTVREGGSLAYSDYADRLYAAKGGNTLEFWEYDPDQDVWSQGEDVGYPSVPDRKLKGGACLGYSSYDDGTYCTIGNGSRQMWCYSPVAGSPEAGGLLGPMAADPGPEASVEVITSSPVRGDIVKVRINVTARLGARLEVYTVSGQRLAELPSANGEFVLRDLVAGVYLLRPEAAGREERCKLLVLR